MRMLKPMLAFHSQLLRAWIGGRVFLVFVLAGAIASPLLVRARASAAPARGETVFQSDFEQSNALRGWRGSGQLQSGYQSQHALAIERRREAPGRGAVMRFPIPIDSLRGCTLRGSAVVKAENVTAKPHPWNGIKFMLALESANGRSWPQAEIDVGSFDWKRVAFAARIPPTATNAELVLGLEEVEGKVWFDDVRFAVAKLPVTPRPRPVAGVPFKGHPLARLRGAMVSPSIDAESLRVLGHNWNANLIRWQLVRHGRPGQAFSPVSYDQWLDGALAKLDAALPLCRKDGLYVVVDLHSPPGGKGTSGGYTGSDDRLFTDRACQDKFVAVWQRIAARYKGVTTIWGYDLANEPVEDLVEEGCDDWQALAERAAKAVRAIDPDRTLIVEPAPWGGPDGLNDFAPLNVSNVVYSVHMYIPHTFTHQGVYQKGGTYPYPGIIDGQFWDKARLEAALQPVVNFQKNYGVAIYVGEFSAIRWAPDHSAYRYLKDLADIFEAHGWDWSYHAFREWSGWNVEHGEDRQDTAPASVPTERERWLRGWFAKNQKPPWTAASP
jgi:endoglucanase